MDFIAWAGLGLGIINSIAIVLTVIWTRRGVMATNIPAVRVSIILRDTSNKVKSPCTHVDLDIKNLSHAISITDIKASIYIGGAEIDGGRFKRLSNIFLFKRLRLIPYYEFPPTPRYIEADKNEVLKPLDFGVPDLITSIEDFLVEKLPQLLQEHKETIGNDIQYLPANGGSVATSVPIIQHQYHNAHNVWVKAVVTYRAEVGGTSTYSGKATVSNLLIAGAADGTTRLKLWNPYY